jgi:REP element-mobilizing transposase RayT
MKGVTNFEPGRFYHVVNHANGMENLFKKEENYIFFLKKYAKHMSSVCNTYAYCLMPNHIHFLIQTHSEKILSEHPKLKSDYHKLIMQEFSNLLNSYTKAYNKMYERKGSLWIDFTKRFLINSDQYLTSTINYIHQNPVKHGFVSNPEDWKFSSFLSFTTDKKTLLQRDEVIDWFGSKEKYIDFHKKESVKLNAEWEI